MDPVYCFCRNFKSDTSFDEKFEHGPRWIRVYKTFAFSIQPDLWFAVSVLVFIKRLRLSTIISTFSKVQELLNLIQIFKFVSGLKVDIDRVACIQIN